ncbi:hypothetical protein IX335_001401 [Porphyromonas levii]|nr:hypothetical protein [Porphyromonas levii]
MPESGTDVYMSFQMSQVASGSGVRAQGLSPSINTDVKDREDFVSRFGVFIFEKGASGTKVAEKFSEYAFFVMKFKKGTYDFYFIANYPTSDETRLSQMSKSELEDYLKAPKPYTLHNVPLEAGPFFPMARVYRDQTISGDGTMMAPIPFKPRVGTTNQLMPVSSFGNDYQPKITQETVNLVRACAKLSFSLSGNGVPDIKSVKYHNVAADYTFMETPERDKKGGEPDVYTAGTEQKLELPAYDPAKPNGPIMVSAYVPERLFVNTNPSWTDHTTNGINFITITMKSGKEYEIPVITNDNFSDSYMDFAVGKSANYSVIRNHHYRYNITVPADDKELVVNYQVMPWTLVESEMSYARPAYDFTLKVVKKINDEVIKEKKYSELGEVIVPPDCYVDISFKITEPRGNMWVASITNGLDFELRGDFKDLVAPAEIVGSNPDKVYNMQIWPRAEYYKEAKYTQFFITVEGRELDLSVKPGNLGKYLGEGSTKRWNIKQVMQ